MMRRRASVFLCFTFPLIKAQPADFLGTLPSIEVSLAPPALPLSSVSSAIGDMDKTREMYEAAMMDNLRERQKSILKSAERKIGSVVRSFVHASNSASLIEDRNIKGSVAFTEAMSVKVNVPALSSEHSSELLTGIRGLAQSHADSDKAMFERAESDMNSLVDFVVAELAAALKSGANVGFLERASHKSFSQTGLPDQASVKVVASDTSFPSMSSLADNFATRQHVASDLATLKLNLMLLDMSRSLNQIIKRDLAVVQGNSLH